MKRNKIIFGTAGIIAIAAVVVTSTWDLGKSVGLYQEKNLSFIQNQSVDDYAKWIEARYIDQETGERITKEKLDLIRQKIAKIPKNKAISFIEQGPDNVGGRTRAIQVDRTNNNRLWAGSVSGGLFVSTDRADNWTRVESFANDGAAMYISSMTQTLDGTLYVATGHDNDYWNGNGIWYSSDFGANWSRIPGSETFTTVNEIVSSDADNYAWFTTGSGLKKWKLGDAAITSVSVTSGPCKSLAISKDGSLVVAAMSTNKTFVSTDGGSTWSDKSGSGAGLVPSAAPRIEYAISAMKNSSNNYSVYAVRTNSNLQGMYVSHDNGNSWSQFVGASGSPSNLDIYRGQGTYNSIVTVAPNDPEKILVGGIDVWQWKQTNNNPPSGGFEQLSLWYLMYPDLGGGESAFVHADNHEMKWDGVGRLYVGNDGGIGVTDNQGQTWYPANRGYNVTQFYGLAFDRHGSVMGGAQDNGTSYNNHMNNTFKEFRFFSGGDGFECEISFFNPAVMFATSQNGSIVRSGNAGNTVFSFSPTYPSSYGDPGVDGATYPFHTEIFLAEYYDLNSEDSVIFMPNQDYTAGDQIQISSLSTGDSITYVTPTNLYYSDTVFYDPSLTIQDVSVVNAMNGQTVYLGNFSWTPFASASGTNPPTIGDSLMVNFPTGADTVVVESIGSYDHYYSTNPSTGQPFSMGIETEMYSIPWDTIKIQDPFQSWFLVFVNKNNGELWGTRNALRFASSDMQWVNIARGLSGNSTNAAYASIDVEFSKDLEQCYISAGSGIWRLDGLGSLYTSDPDFEQKAGYVGTPTATPPTGTTLTKITTTTYEGIAVNPSNADDVVAFSGFGGQMRRTLNATSATPTWTALTSITSPSVAVYDGIIDRNDSDVIVVGTSFGAFISEDGGASWTNSSAGFEGVPVYEVRQNWRSFDEGNNRPGEIYIATHGRGIWSSESFLGISDANGTPNSNTFKTKLKTYPNPTTDNTTLTFNLSETSTVNVYVYSISGQLMKTITRKNMEAGAQTLTIDGDDLQKGTYIVKFIAGKQNDTVKFIKM